MKVSKKWSQIPTLTSKRPGSWPLGNFLNVEWRSGQADNKNVSSAGADKKETNKQ